MKVAIDISQLAYPNTGVANYLGNLVSKMVVSEHEFILFFSSFRGSLPKEIENLSKRENVEVRRFKIPPVALDLLWNKLHQVPIEKFIGPVDLFITSDWTEPPAQCKKATILYDLIVYRYPEETDSKIVLTQKRKLEWVKKESDVVFCISEATMKDAEEILQVDKKVLKVIYPGLTI